MKNFKLEKKYLYWGMTAFCVVVASIAFFWVLNTWGGIRAGIGMIISALSPFIYGILIAYLLNRVLATFERKLFKPLAARLFPKNAVTARKAARVFSIILTLMLALGFIVGILIIVLPEIFKSIVNLVDQSQHYVEVVIKWLEKFLNGDALEPVAVTWINSIFDKLVGWLETNVIPQITTIVSSITGGVISVIGVIVNFLIGIVISVYVMYNKETFCGQAKKILYSVFRPKTANKIIGEMDFINDAFGNYIVGTLIDSLIVGVVNYIFMGITLMPYGPLVSIIVAVTNIIPMFGPFIGAVPSALLILLEDPSKCLVFLIFTVILQQIDGQIIKPRIHSSRTGLSGFWIMFAILFFGGLFGILGMIVGVPLTTVLYSILKRLNNRRLRRRGLPEGTDFYMDIEVIDPDTGMPIYKEGIAQAANAAEGDAPEAVTETVTKTVSEGAGETAPQAEAEESRSDDTEN